MCEQLACGYHLTVERQRIDPAPLESQVLRLYDYTTRLHMIQGGTGTVKQGYISCFT